MSACHAEDVCSGNLPGILDELLKPALGLLRLLDRVPFRRAGLVLGELGADQVKYWGNSFPELDAVRYRGVPFLDQLIEVLLGVGFKHYDKVFKKPKQTVSNMLPQYKKRKRTA